MTAHIITGGGTGIGAATARLLADAGGDVVIVGRRPEPLQAVAATHERVHAMTADAADGADMARVVAATAERFGGVAGLVANAGGHGYSTVGDTTDDEWRASLEANLTTAFVAIRAALGELERAQGSIVVVSSIAGLAAGPETAGYTVGKHALLGLVRSVARDYGRRGVRINALCPGWVRTPMSDAEMSVLVERGDAQDVESAYALVTRDVPLGRAALPEEIAATIGFLLGPASAYVHGATIVADGGSTIVDVPTLAYG
ncbi:SDR family NAD(P)-dependent oxidoreductase [Microbacterium sp. JZ31]|uniref:SDR family NAD(P)-dependent oxidoreductase n=1 Tax=Microbacterium sp. JZ31 TaxID=1906274 RepID=UPI00193363DF|nr:SDR family oxidoreductase [Microbacterium sp. JZ31]